MARNIWSKLEDTDVKYLAKGIKLTNEDRESIVLSVEKAVQAAIQSEPVSELNEHIINHFFEHSGKKSYRTNFGRQWYHRKNCDKRSGRIYYSIFRKSG